MAQYFENVKTLDELQKQSPGIEIIQDTEKKPWEK